MAQEEVVEFKGTKKGIFIQIKTEKDFDMIKRQLIEKIEKTKSFFSGAKVFDIQCDILTNEEKEELKNLITTKYHINIENQIDHDAKTSEEIFQGIVEGKTKFITGTLRSGQRVFYEGNIVILGDVNPGAHVVAYGNIVVMGSLRGIAHAGSNGNIHAYVAANYLDPTQLRIADLIARAPDGAHEKPKGPELAKIRENMVYIEPCLSKKQQNDESR